MDDESLRWRLDAAAPPASPDAAQLAAIHVRAERLRRLRNRRVALGGLAVLVLIAAGSLVALRGPESKTSVEISSPTTSSSSTGSSAAPETTVAESTTETTATEPGPALAESPTTVLPPPFGAGGGKLLYTSASDTAGQGLSATYGNGTENGPFSLPDGVSSVSGPQWSPDRSKIAFASGSDGLWIMSANGTGARHVTSGWDLEPLWSPDGKSLAVTRISTSPHQVVIVSVASGAELATAVADTAKYWAPDSSAVAFTDNVGGPSGPDHPGNIYVLPRTGGAATQITTDADSNAHVTYFASEWEPNGRLTYARNASAGDGTFTSRSDGTDVVQLSDQFAGVVWSSQDLAALSVSRSEVRIVNGQGAKVASVSATDAATFWSPDGSALALASTDGLVFVRSNGSTISKIDGLAVWGGEWSPDGTLFAGTAQSPSPSQSSPWMRDLVVASIDGASATIGSYSGEICCGVWIDW